MSTKADKRKKSLRAYARKRARRPQALVSQRVSLKIKRSLEQRIVRSNADVLQNVEFSLVNAANESDEVDDYVVEQILRHAIKGDSPEHPTIRRGMDLLAAVRELRSDIADDLWQNALRVVYASLQRHSSCRPGDTSYLDFVSRFVG